MIRGRLATLERKARAQATGRPGSARDVAGAIEATAQLLVPEYHGGDLDVWFAGAVLALQLEAQSRGEDFATDLTAEDMRLAEAMVNQMREGAGNAV